MPINNKDIKTFHFGYWYKLQGNDASQTLKDSTERIQLAEELGYSRYWFANIIIQQTKLVHLQN